jgi:hypothetical protein
MTARGSSQVAFVPLRGISKNVLCLSSPRGIVCRAGIEISGTNLAMLSDDEQQTLYEMYWLLLRSITYPVQLLIHIRPLSLDAYIQQFLADGPIVEPWQLLSLDHAALLRQLVKERPLFSRKFYLFVPSAEETVRLRFRSKKRKMQDFARLEEQLSQRIEQLCTQFTQLGFSCRRLKSLELARLYDTAYTMHRQEYPLESAALSTVGNFPETPIIHRRSKPPQSLGGANGASRTQDKQEPPGAAQRNAAFPPRLEDLLAPSSVDVWPDALCLEAQEYVRIYTMDVLPRSVVFGWMRRLLEINEPVDLVHHLVPRQDSLASLRRQYTHRQALALSRAKGSGKSGNPGAALSVNDLGPVVEAMSVGEESLFDSALHILVRGASSKEELEKRSRVVCEALYAVFQHRARLLVYEQRESFRRFLPGSLGPIQNALPTPARAIATMLPFHSQVLFHEQGILEGISTTREPIVLDWWQLANAARVVIGSSGWGKSYKLKLDLLHIAEWCKNRAAKRWGAGGVPQITGRMRTSAQDGFQAIVLDPEREFVAPVQALGGQDVIFAPGSQHHINPLDLPRATSTQRESATSGNRLAAHIQQIHRILDVMLAPAGTVLTTAEKSFLDDGLYETYRRAGITTDPATHYRPAPLLKDLYHVLVSGTVGQDSTNLAQRLRRFTHGSLSALFSEPTNVRLDQSIIRIDTKELQDELRDVGLLMIANMIWTASFASNIPRYLFIDEVSLLSKHPAGLSFLQDLLRRARKHYLSVSLATQYPEHLTQELVSLCEVQVLMHQNASALPEIERTFQLAPEQVRLLKTFGKGDALMLISSRAITVHFNGSRKEDELCTTNQQQLAAQSLEQQSDITQTFSKIVI